MELACHLLAHWRASKEIVEQLVNVIAEDLVLDTAFMISVKY